MARYLVLEYADNEEADAAIQKMNEATRNGKRVRVVGLFAPPKIFACQCGLIDLRYRKGKAERGDKFGWWLCADCNKPRAGGHQLNNLLSLDKILGRGPSGMTRDLSDKVKASHYEWKVASIGIFEVPLDNIKRKKKWRLKR